MKFLVTGATGFIGSNFCRRLISDGHEVLALVRSPEKMSEFSELGIEWLRGDLSFFEQEDLQLPPCDLVVHLATRMGPPSDEWFREKPLAETQGLVTCLLRQSWRPRRFLFASSVAATGPTWGAEPLKEDDAPLEPVEAYGLSKKVVEEYLQSITEFPVTVFRAPLVFGPEKRIQQFFRLAKRGLGFRMERFNQQQSFIFIDDLVEAMVAMCQEQSSGFEAYFTTYPQPCDLETLWEVLGDITGNKIRVIKIPQPLLYWGVQLAEFFKKAGSSNTASPLNWRLYRQMTSGHFIASSEKLQRRLDWMPAFDLERTLRESYRRLEDKGLF